MVDWALAMDAARAEVEEAQMKGSSAGSPVTGPPIAFRKPRAVDAPFPGVEAAGDRIADAG